MQRGADMTIVAFTAADLTARRAELARLLGDAVEQGASLGFTLPFAEGEMESYWGGVASAVASGAKRVWAALDDAGPQVAVALSDMGGNEDEVVRGRALHLAGGTGLVPMGGAHRAAELQLSAEPAVDGADDRTVPSHVDKGRGDCAVEAVNVPIGDHLVAEAEPLDEGHIAWRGQADHPGPRRRMAGQHVEQADGRLGRGAAHQHLLGAEKAVIDQIVIEQIAGAQQRQEQAPLVLQGLHGLRLTGGPLIVIVEDRQCGAMGR